ncbi:hypothetical protein L6164_005937 [Bauhinia variegata]|uniref:Uncharacterized protein n=1 Tax=Bauhinia variegata TaxID=167791 RepID=A0ACB9PSX8_BAUVA|nr:hypothetical protein L6164_005937 [Bauhinia variegata]
MAKDLKISSSPLPLTNSDNKQTKICSLLPLFGSLNITITSGTAIFRAHSNGDIPMLIFITFLYFGTILLRYWFRLYHSLPRREKWARKHKLKTGIWVLLCSIMFGFACEFSTFMSPVESLSFFAVVSGGNSVLFYVSFIWNVSEPRTCDGAVCSGSQHQVSIGIPTVNDPETGSSPLPATNSETETTIYSFLPFFAFINTSIISCTVIYRSHNNGDIPMVLFVTFVYFGTIFLDYWLRLCHDQPRLEKSARKHELKVGIWVLLCSIMFGFACEFSILMKAGESPAISAVVIGGSSLIFYVYFIWKGFEDELSNLIKLKH